MSAGLPEPVPLQDTGRYLNNSSRNGYQQVVAIHETTARFYRAQLPGSWVPGYLAGRGFSPVVQQQWRVGYAPPGRRALLLHLRAAGYRDALIVAAGLARRSRHGELSDVFGDRAMFPIRSDRGAIIAFIGRAGERAAGAVPRYLNSPASVLYDKGRALFGLWEALPAVRSGAVPVIVEGPLDAIAVAAASQGGGGYAPVAPCGTALTGHQVAALSRAGDLAASGVLVGFDGDDAGRRAAVRAYPLLRPHTARIGAVMFPAGQDPAQILHDHGPGALAGLLAGRARPLADLVLDAEVARWEPGLGFAEGRIGALRAIAPVIADLARPDVARQVARLARRLDLDHQTVTDAVTSALARASPAGSAPSAPGQGSPARQARLPGLGSTAAGVSSKDFPHGAFRGAAAPDVSPPPAPPGTAAGPDRRPLRRGHVAG